MKKILCMLLAVQMCISLTACGVPGLNEVLYILNRNSQQASNKEEVDDFEYQQELVDDTLDESIDTEQNRDAISDNSQETDESSDAEEPSTSTGDGNVSTDVESIIGNYVNPADYSVENPIPMGTWVEVTRYCVKDNCYRNVYVRIDNIYRQSKDTDIVNKYISENNEFASDYYQINLDELDWPEDVEACIVEYEVYVPEDFPTESYGIVTPDIDFRVEHYGGVPSTINPGMVYIGIGASFSDLFSSQRNDNSDYMVGNTYKFASLFSMVKDYTDFKLDCTYYPDGMSSYSDDGANELLHAYFSVV